MDLPKFLLPLVVRGAPFTFRTFADLPFGAGSTPGVPRQTTLDRLVTVTLPAIAGEEHPMVPTMEVRLYSDSTIRAHDKKAGTYVDGRSTRHKKEQA